MLDPRAQQIPRGYGTGWIKEAWQILRISPVLWVFACILTVLLLVVVETVTQLGLAAQNNYLEDILRGRTPSPPTYSFSDYAMMSVVMIVQTLAESFVASGQFHMGINGMRRQIVRIEDTVAAGSRTLPMFGYMLIVYLPGLVSWIVAMVWTAYSKAAIEASMMVGLMFWTMVFLLIWTVELIFVLPGQALVADGVRPLEALARSVRGAARHFGAIIGALTVFTLLCFTLFCTCGLAGLVLFPMWWILLALMARDVAGLPAHQPGEEEAMPPVDYGGGGGAWPPPPMG